MFGDAFWNSARDGFFMYIIQIMSCWMIYCEIWFLPPVYRKSTETDIEFAARVRHVIAKHANIVELDWDGNLKRSKLPPKFKQQLQAEFAKSVIIPKYSDICPHNFISMFYAFDKYLEKYKLDSARLDTKARFIDDMALGVKRSVLWKGD